MKPAPCEQFVADFVMFYNNMFAYPSTVVDVELEKLYEKAQKIQSDRLGDCINRVIKHYNIKPKKKQKRISKYL